MKFTNLAILVLGAVTALCGCHHDRPAPGVSYSTVHTAKPGGANIPGIQTAVPSGGGRADIPGT